MASLDYDEVSRVKDEVDSWATTKNTKLVSKEFTGQFTSTNLCGKEVIPESIVPDMTYNEATITELKNKATNHFLMGDLVVAEDLLTQALERTGPMIPPISSRLYSVLHSNRSQIRIQQGDFANALEDAEEALARDELNIKAEFRIALCLWELKKDTSRALQLIDKVLTIYQNAGVSAVEAEELKVKLDGYNRENMLNELKRKEEKDKTEEAELFKSFFKNNKPVRITVEADDMDKEENKNVVRPKVEILEDEVVLNTEEQTEDKKKLETEKVEESLELVDDFLLSRKKVSQTKIETPNNNLKKEKEKEEDGLELVDDFIMDLKKRKVSRT